MENGRKTGVAAQSKVDLGDLGLLANFVKNCSKIPEFGIKPNAFDCIRIFMLSNVMKF